MFKGYSDQTVDLFWGIRLNNSREWFAPQKEAFREAVMEPTRALGNELYDWFMENHPELELNLHISRIYRDARRLFGRGPLKDHIWFSFQNENDQRAEAPCFWFEVGADGYGCGIGWWMQPAGALRFRRVIDRDPAAARKLMRALKKRPDLLLEGETYAKPKGRAGEDLERWYNLRSFSISCMRKYDELAYSPELVGWLKEIFTFLIPYYQLLDRAYRLAE